VSLEDGMTAPAESDFTCVMIGDSTAMKRNAAFPASYNVCPHRLHRRRSDESGRPTYRLPITWRG